jgi:hypothetical protein
MDRRAWLDPRLRRDSLLAGEVPLEEFVRWRSIPAAQADYFLGWGLSISFPGVVST